MAIREALTDDRLNAMGWVALGVSEREVRHTRLMRRSLLELDRLVQPWLQEWDHWRYRDMLPELDDMLTVMSRLPGIGDTMTVEVHYQRGNVEVGCPKFAHDTWEQGNSVEEAVFHLLLGFLEQVCPDCHAWDGHERSCGQRDQVADAESAALDLAGL